ncbi:MAG: hypothetical protein HYV97_02335 [Bdellovibrio sp.]|nr:hypothetical protein [Bdellovibrio sp.]
MEKDALNYGAVIFTTGKRKGQLGYYDDDSDDDNRAIVYFGCSISRSVLLDSQAGDE